MHSNQVKPIGLLGGTSWPSTSEIYEAYNRTVAERKGGHHSADLVLRSIDYHDIKSRYPSPEGWEEIPALLKDELLRVAGFNVCCIAICNNTLHRALLSLDSELEIDTPIVSIIDAVGEHCVQKGYKNIAFLGTRFTMEDGFFTKVLDEKFNVVSVIPSAEERERIQEIQSKIASGEITEESRAYFEKLIASYRDKDAVILACTELPLVAPESPPVPVIDPAKLQMEKALEIYFAQFD